MNQMSYLFELGCEELPSSGLPEMAAQLKVNLDQELKKARLGFDSIEIIAGPRRLGAKINGLAAFSSAVAIEKRGPAVVAAYQEGEPTKALQGFCKGLGIDVDDVATIETEKGHWVVYYGQEAGEPVSHLLTGIVVRSVKAIPLSKPMRWGTSLDVFPRPVRWILSLLENKVMPLSLFNLSADHLTYGHRFHAPEAILLEDPNHYFEQLRKAFVEPSFERRKAIIWEQIQAKSSALGVKVDQDDALLNEIHCLVEWPNALSGIFDKRFLEVPEVAIIAAMRGHQKYFHTRNNDGALSNHFITVCNIKSKDPEKVIMGNQRVINARLADAKFFFESDIKHTLASRLNQLNNIIFHPKLGSLGEKTTRLQALMEAWAGTFAVDRDNAIRLAMLSRCDLVADMVLEFDELQGEMGSIYAALDDEPDSVSEAIKCLYQPAGATDHLPQSSLGTLLAMAERADTLAGLFGINQPPNGSKDPFALRRAAIGLIRLNNHPSAGIDLKPFLNKALRLQPVEFKEETLEQIINFIQDREKVRLIDIGLRHDAVIAAQGTAGLWTSQTEGKAVALNSFFSNPIAHELILSNKRVANVLEKEGLTTTSIDEQSLIHPAEIYLYAELIKKQPLVIEAVSRETFESALNILAQLKEPIDLFFDEVMVNTEDQKIRANRHALLHSVRDIFLLVGDLSRIQG